MFALQSIESFHSARIQFNGISDVCEHLLKGVSCLLIQQDPDSFTGFDTTPDDRHQLGFDEVFGLSFSQLVLWGGKRWQRARCAHLHVDRPVGIDILSVVHITVWFIRSTHIAFTCREENKMNGIVLFKILQNADIDLQLWIKYFTEKLNHTFFSNTFLTSCMEVRGDLDIYEVEMYVLW